MKKILFTLGLLATVSYTNAANLTIVNNHYNKVTIQMMKIVKPNAPDYDFCYSCYNEDHFSLSPYDYLEITDNNSNNYQFPFLNIYPFIGNVISNGTLANLPLPFATDEEKYKLYYIKFFMEGGYHDGFGSNDNLGISFAIHTGNYPPHIGGSYQVTYFDYHDQKFLLFE